jgi:hypothetical protein
MHLFLPQVLYTVSCLSKLYTDIIFVKKELENDFKEKKKAQIGTSVRVRVFNAGLLARSPFTSGRSCDRPTRARFSVVFLCPRDAALPMVT